MKPAGFRVACCVLRMSSSPFPISHFLRFCLLPFAFYLLPFNSYFDGSPTNAFAATNQEVEEALTCQCGCGLTVHSCNHLQCGFAVPAKKTIAELLGQGQGKEAITASFVSHYGEKVLSAPTTTGFNLVAWITPFAALLLGGVLVGLISLRWTRRQRPESTEQPLPTTTVADRERLKKELESFEG